MYFYAVLMNNKVVAIYRSVTEILSNAVISISEAEFKDSLIGTEYNAQTKQFSGLKAVLSLHSPPTIHSSHHNVSIDRIENEDIELKCSIMTWDGNPVSDYQSTIQFEVNETEHTVSAENGVATLSLHEPGVYEVSVINHDLITHGSHMTVTVH
ncbi:hypothetical protein [Longirhabdus pacifica]|uniref:hypothetical protein n=1 Tax=Longirhabdus pacifica TaxID=2305227 RepID=UPI001008B923|nr:hypothetical protein [Longirhabdus pacifica]